METARAYSPSHLIELTLIPVCLVFLPAIYNILFSVNSPILFQVIIRKFNEIVSETKKKTILSVIYFEILLQNDI